MAARWSSAELVAGSSASEIAMAFRQLAELSTEMIVAKGGNCEFIYHSLNCLIYVDY